jgi:hypothetical protein
MGEWAIDRSIMVRFVAFLPGGGSWAELASIAFRATTTRS